MPEALDDWFEWPDPPPAASTLLAVLRRRARSWSVYGIRPVDTNVYDETQLLSRLIFMVDIVDRERASVVGCPRVEFDGATIAGCWGSSHYCDEIDPTADDSFSVDAAGLDLERVAEIAADWFDAQVRRPVERREWRRNRNVFHRRWVLADSGRILCLSDDENQQREELQEPDVITQLRTSSPG